MRLQNDVNKSSVRVLVTNSAEKRSARSPSGPHRKERSLFIMQGFRHIKPLKDAPVPPGE